MQLQAERIELHHLQVAEQQASYSHKEGDNEDTQGTFGALGVGQHQQAALIHLLHPLEVASSPGSRHSAGLLVSVTQETADTQPNRAARPTPAAGPSSSKHLEELHIGRTALEQPAVPRSPSLCGDDAKPHHSDYFRHT